MCATATEREVVLSRKALNIFLRLDRNYAVHVQPVPDMTYNVFGGTLSLTQSINQSKSQNVFVISSANLG